MLKQLKEMLDEIEEALIDAELKDVAYTDHYAKLKKKRMVLRKAIKSFEKIGD